MDFRALGRPTMKNRKTRPVFALSILLLLAVCGTAMGQAELRYSELARAARDRDETRVRSLLAGGVPVDGTDAESMTALHWAAHWGDGETVRALLDAGADATVTNRYGVTPLHLAGTVGNVAILEALLAAGADPNAAYGSGETALMTAARTGIVESVRLLLDYGGDPDAAEEWRGQTALMWAAVENHPEVARLLIDNGADVDAVSTVFDFQELSQGAGGAIVDRPTGGLTALMFAARSGANEVGKVLVAAGVDMNRTEPQYGFSAMQTALVNGHWDFAAFLAENGADVNDGSLYSAVETRNTPANTNRPAPPDRDERYTSMDVIRILLEHGADPNRVYARGYPPRQAQGEVRVPPGATPLHRAIRAMDTDAIRALMEHGANPSLAMNDGSLPLLTMAGLGARGRFDEETRLEIIKMFWAAGADVGVVHRPTGNTALHLAAERGATRIVDFLIAAGGSLHAVNEAGETPADLLAGAAPRNRSLP
jgi:ankyrin repeat protein